MTFNPEIHHRRSIRLKGYDYSQEGLYFITICVQDRECLFGKIVDHPIMKLNDAGKIADQCWLAIPQHYPRVVLHEYVVMPNHVHGIIEITENVGTNVGAKNFSPNDFSPNDFVTDDMGANDVSDVGAKNFSPLPHQQLPRSPSRTIGSIVRGFKIGVTKWFDQSVWQRDYYEHIIRSTDEYERIANYIINNPAKWREDKFFK